MFDPKYLEHCKKTFFGDAPRFTIIPIGDDFFRQPIYAMFVQGGAPVYDSYSH